MQKAQIYYSKACGKVLIGGGYGVLQQNNIGFSLALQNYFYCRLKVLDKQSQTHIFVKSPQIQKKYQYQIKNNIELYQISNQQNIFVQNALKYSLNHFRALETIGSIEITLFFDKGFISQNNIVSFHQKFSTYSQEYSKTGLGSSACVVVSIVSSICSLFGCHDNNNLINAISQVSNLSAQKKIGSNFDISTAVFSSHLYKNILPSSAYTYINEKDLSSLQAIDPQVNSILQVNKLLKENYVAFMIDVQKGANTRIMVKNFLNNLNKQEQQVKRQFFQTSKVITQQLYEAFCCQGQQPSQLKQILLKINKSHRKLHQKYSILTQTSVQPTQLRDFLNYIMQDKNILYIICPGSGGFDALFMIGFKTQNSQYYQNLVSQANQIYREKLGMNVHFNLNQVKIKWDNQMKVSQSQIQIIQSYLNSLN